MSRLITGVNARHATVRLQSQLCLAVFQVLLPRVFPFRIVVFVDIVEREQVRIVAHHQFVQVDGELAQHVLPVDLSSRAPWNLRHIRVNAIVRRVCFPSAMLGVFLQSWVFQAQSANQLLQQVVGLRLRFQEEIHLYGINRPFMLIDIQPHLPAHVFPGQRLREVGAFIFIAFLQQLLAKRFHTSRDGNALKLQVRHVGLWYAIVCLGANAY